MPHQQIIWVVWSRTMAVGRKHIGDCTKQRENDTKSRFARLILSSKGL
jgi:hypothetical protein